MQYYSLRFEYPNCSISDSPNGWLRLRFDFVFFLLGFAFILLAWHRLSKLISAHMAERKRWFSPFHLPFNYGKASTSIYSAHLPIRKRLSPSCKGFSLFYFDTKRNGLYFSVSTSFQRIKTSRTSGATGVHLPQLEP